MKRRIAIILLFLLLGAIVNVGVAWGCAMTNELNADWPNVERTTAGDWRFVVVDRRFGSEEVRCCHRLSDAVDVQKLPCYAGNHWWRSWHARLGPPGTGQWGLAHGWPMYSLSVWRGWKTEARQPETDGDFATFGGWDVAVKNGRSETTLMIPFTPIWPGVLINTLFYALLLWLLFITPFTIRRKVRRKRSQCEKCAYPIGVSPVCTECGAALPTKVEA